MKMLHQNTDKESLSSPVAASHTGMHYPPHSYAILLTESRHRHLLNDLYKLLPHSRKDAKLDTKTKLYQLNEIADLYNCNVRTYPELFTPSYLP